MHNDLESKVFDGIELSELNTNKLNSNKITYFNYLINMGFLNNNIPINDYFEQFQNNNGYLNCFPINIKGRNMNNSLITRGFKLQLSFINPNTTTWFLSIRWIFQGIIDLKKEHENININFNNI